MLIDFHTHLFSRSFFEALAAQSDLPGSPEERIEHVCRTAGLDPPPSDVDAHTRRWLAEMERYGVGHMVTFASVAEEAASVRAAVANAQGKLSGFVVVDPTKPEAAEHLDAALDEDGFRGALTFPALHGYRVDGPEFQKLLATLRSHRSVVIVHCGMLRIPLRDRFGLPGQYDLALANPLHLVPVANAAPEVCFVIPHFGAGFFRETLMTGAQCANVMVDTSSSNEWVATQPERIGLVDVFERTLAVFGAERILFGTDSSIFPRGWRHDILRAQREALGACGVSSSDRDRILGGNAARLLSLGR